jgi:radical SAM superfamily enzyme YgiQ (UPF0313 family)
MERILLISSNREHFPEPVFPLGVSYVASGLVRSAKKVRIFDAGIHRFPIHRLRREIATYSPDIIGLSLRNIDNAAYPHTRYYVPGYLRMMAAIRACSSVPVVLGGSAFSIFPNEVLRVFGADYGIVGDGDGCEIDSISLNGKSVLYAQQPDLGRVEFPRNINEIFPSFNKYRTIGVQTARGCPHHCIYCTYPILEGNRLRLRPAAAVADDIEFLYRTFGKRDFFITDSTFNADERHMEEVCRTFISRRLPIRFSCYLYPRMNDPSIFRLLAEAGCVAVDFGTDAAAESMLKSLRKGFSVSDIRRVSRACRQAGIDSCHSLVFGGPGENAESVAETARRMDEIRPKAVVAMTGVRIYPGTEMARIAGFKPSPGLNLLKPQFYFHGEKEGLFGKIRECAASRRNWFLPGERDWSSALGPRLLRFFYRSGPLWRTFRSS